MASNAFSKAAAAAGVTDDDDAGPDCDDVPASDTAVGVDLPMPPLRSIGTWDDVRDASVSFGIGGQKFASVERYDTTWHGAFHFLCENISFRRHPGNTPEAKEREKHARPYIAASTLKDWTKPKPYKLENGKWRRPKNLKQDNVDGVTLCMGDVDGEQSVADAVRVLDALGVAYGVYASPSYTKAVPKFRTVVAMQPFPIKPGDLEDRAVFAETYELVMTALGIKFDPSCTDLNQYYIAPCFQLPPSKAFFAPTGNITPEEETLGRDLLAKACSSGDFVLYWRPGGFLNFGEIAEHVRAARELRKVNANRPPGYTRKTWRGGGVSYVSNVKLVTENLPRFVSEFGQYFKISEAAEHYEGTDPAAFSSRDDVKGKAWIRCPNNYGEVSERPHTSGFENGNVGAFYVQDGRGEWKFTIHCATRGCKDHFGRPDNPSQQDRWRLLDLLCQRWGVTDATDLIDFCDLPEDEEGAS